MFTLLKNPFHKKVFFFSIPIILSMFTQQFYNVADTMIVGQFLGVDELAAVGNAGTIVMLFIVVSGGIELSSEIIFSSYKRKKDLQKIANGSINIIAIALTISITLVALGFLCLPTLYRWIHLPNELIPFTNAYIMTYMIGVPFIYVYDISRAIITALGDSKHCFYFIIDYHRPKSPNWAWEWIKTIFVCIICFCGASFAIMTFNNDVSVTDVFSEIYRIIMGKESTGFTILEGSYSGGLALGIVGFFNHFAKFKINTDPTPLEVEMRLYEDNVSKTLIQNDGRKEQDIDVS